MSFWRLVSQKRRFFEPCETPEPNTRRWLLPKLWRPGSCRPTYGDHTFPRDGGEKSRRAQLSKHRPLEPFRSATARIVGLSAAKQYEESMVAVYGYRLVELTGRP